MKKILELFKGLSRPVLTLRVLAGGYLIYLGYQLFTSDPESNISRWVTKGVPVIFWLVGGIFAIASLYEMSRQKYEALAAAALSEDGEEPATPVVFKHYEKKIMDFMGIKYE